MRRTGFYLKTRPKRPRKHFQKQSFIVGQGRLYIYRPLDPFPSLLETTLAMLLTLGTWCPEILEQSCT